MSILFVVEKEEGLEAVKFNSRGVCKKTTPGYRWMLDYPGTVTPDWFVKRIQKGNAGIIHKIEVKYLEEEMLESAEKHCESYENTRNPDFLRRAKNLIAGARMLVEAKKREKRY